MYTKDKAQRITLRLNEEQFGYVKMSSEMLGVSPSEYLRMLVNVTMSVDNKVAENIRGKVGNGRENDKTDINDKL